MSLFGWSIRPVLLVEDDPDFALLVRLAFREAEVRNPVQVVSTVQGAKMYLAGEPPYDNRKHYPLPSLVVMDLRLLDGTGFELLDWLQSHQDLIPVPVVVLTVSAEQADKQRAYRLGVRDYVVKQRAVRELVGTVRAWAKQWLGEEDEERAEAKGA